MTSSSKRPSEPPIDAADAADIEESTAVRARPQPVTPKRRRFQSGVWQAASGTDRTDRLEQKLRAARALLASLPVDHPRARLLRIAIVRRDEVVLDGILHALGVPPR